MNTPKACESQPEYYKEQIMLDTLLWIAVGAFIGWNFPQPFWAKIIQEKIQGMIAKKQ